MTQKCQHDEQLLDYVYGELSDAERKIFADHLVTCSTCPAQVQSFGGIRQEFQQRPPIEPAGEAMQRMTALLMQAAAAQHGPAAGAAADGGGKVLLFRSRGLRRILFHPAGGVMAVAAAALFWVVFRAQPVPPTGLSAPTSATAFIPEPAREGAAATATPDPVALEKSAPSKEADSAPRLAGGDAKMQAVGRSGIIADKSGQGDALKDSNFDGLRARSRDGAGLLAKNEQKPQPGSPPMVTAKPLPPTPVPSKPAMVAQLAPTSPTTGAAAGKADTARATGSVAQYRSSGPAVVAMADQAYGKAAKKSSADRYEAERPAEHWSPPPAAEPPPPPAAVARPRSLNDEETASVRENIARTQERRKQKVVDELANQELGTLAAGGTAGAPATSAAATDNRYAQRGAVNSSPTDTGSNTYGSPSAPSPTEDTPTPAATPAMPAPNQLNLNRGAVIGGAADDSSSALSTAKEQLRRGQCSEANATLARLERTLPLLHGLSETRAEWQASCATPSQQLLDRRMNLDSAEQAAPAPPRAMKSRMASPMPAKAPANKPSKAPSKAKAADAL